MPHTGHSRNAKPRRQGRPPAPPAPMVDFDPAVLSRQWASIVDALKLRDRRRFLTASEVADLCAMPKKQLQNWGSRHRIYRPTFHCRYHPGHVRIIERVLMGAITPGEGEAWLTLMLKRERGEMPAPCKS